MFRPRTAISKAPGRSNDRAVKLWRRRIFPETMEVLTQILLVMVGAAQCSH